MPESPTEDMSKLLTHIVTFAAINALLIAIWVLVGGGSVLGLQQIAHDPTIAVHRGFWPIWPILGWGTFLVIHAGAVLSDLAFGGKARRRRRRMARDAARTSQSLVREVSTAIDKAQQRRMEREERRARRHGAGPVTPPPPPPPGTPAPPSRTSEGHTDTLPMTAASGKKWVTVMFSDIADSTKLNHELGDDEWHRVLRRVRTIIRSAVRGRDGEEVGTQGDGSLARFGSPADAVLCAVDIQENLGSARATGSFIPEVRIGVHAGEAVEADGDLVGRVINLASRVMDEAEPGEILVTEPVADQLVGRLELEDKGLRELKGLPQPRHLLAVRWSGPGAAGS